MGWFNDVELQIGWLNVLGINPGHPIFIGTFGPGLLCGLTVLSLFFILFFQIIIFYWF